MALPTSYVVRVYVAALRGRRALVGIVEDAAGVSRSFHSAEELWAIVAARRFSRFGSHSPRTPRRTR